MTCAFFLLNPLQLIMLHLVLHKLHLLPKLGWVGSSMSLPMFVCVVQACFVATLWLPCYRPLWFDIIGYMFCVV